ncbi:hypothetical protein O5511_12475 [Escherichia coli]|nr:hypothetical protein [Escherichia coli]
MCVARSDKDIPAASQVKGLDILITGHARNGYAGNRLKSRQYAHPLTRQRRD